MQTTNSQPLPSLAQLFKAVGIALVVAAVILVTVVLPAEYGIDPIGVGKVLGLAELNDVEQEELSASLETLPDDEATATGLVETGSEIVVRSEVPYHSEKKSVLLQPGEGIEIKARMLKGDSFVFNWGTDGGQVFVDMHGEKPDANGEFTSYWEEKRYSNAQGSFTAPFDGSHGWYWRNREKEPLELSLEVSGFYEELYTPK